MTQTRAFSNSEFGTWKRCKRKWWLGTHRGLRKRGFDVVGAKELGTRVHEALASWYVPEGMERANPLDALEASIVRDIMMAPEQEPAIRKEAELAHAMITGYLEWIEETGEDSNLEVIAPETEIRVELGEVRPGGPIVFLVGKLDVKVRRVSDGLLFFLDHKTVGNLTEPLPMLPLNEQMKTYMLIERVNNARAGDVERTAGGLYNMLRKVKRTAKANPPFYGREFVTYNDTTLRNFWDQLMGQIDDILEAEERLARGANHRYVVPPTPTRDCTWDCAFKGICDLIDDGSDYEGMIASAYEVGDPYARYDTVEMRTEEG